MNIGKSPKPPIEILAIDKLTGVRELIPLDELCCDDGPEGETVLCTGCSVWGRVIDDGSMPQPRPICGAPEDQGRPYCWDCAGKLFHR